MSNKGFIPLDKILQSIVFKKIEGVLASSATGLEDIVKAFFIFCGLCALLLSPLSGEELTLLTLHKAKKELQSRDPRLILPKLLRPYHRHHISVQGYLYETPSGDWVIADRPNMKSCCIGSEKELFQQIFVEMDQKPPGHNKLVRAEGTFQVDVLKNQDGGYVRIYSLQDATVAALGRSRMPWLTLGSVLGVAAVALGVWLQKRGRGRAKSTRGPRSPS